MSKQSEAKEKQGYKKQDKFCSTCRFYNKEVKQYHNGYIMDIKKRCGIGGFAIMLTSVCNEWVKDEHN